MAKRKKKHRPIMYEKAAVATDLMDVDYWSKLSPEEKEWRRRFDREYYKARDLTKGAIHTKLAHKRSIYRAKEASESSVDLVSYEDFTHLHSTPSPEDALIEHLDKVKKKKNTLK